MSAAKSWRGHADSLAAERASLYPGSVALPASVTFCPVHGEPVGSVTRMCLLCHVAAWEHTAATFLRARSAA